MKIEKQFLEDHQVKLTVEADPAQFEEAKRRAARTIAKRTKIPGFRPGKAPYHIIERFAGEEAIFEDALEILVQDLYPKVIDEAEIQPYGPGKLEGIPSRDPLTFEFTIPLKAEVELSEYRSIRRPYELEPVTDQDIDKVIENMRQQQAVLEPAGRPAEEGDQVNIRISGERLNPQEDQPKILIREMPAPIVIEPGDTEDPEEYPFPGFSRQLIGLSEGDEKTIPYTYPDDSHFESLRGTEAEFSIKVESIKSRQLPELDDEFASSQAEYNTLDELRAEIRERLEERRRSEYDQFYTDQVMDEIVEASTIKFPPQMVEDEIESLLHDLGHRLERQNMDIDTYLKTRQMEMPALRDELRQPAEKRLRRLLVLFEIGRSEDIQVETSEVQTETINTVGQLFSNMPEKEARKQLTRESIAELSNTITADLMVQKSLNRVRDIASGKAEEDEARAAAEAAAAEQAAGAEAEAEAGAESEAEAGAADAQEKAETPEGVEPSEAAGGSPEAAAQPEEPGDGPAEDETGEDENIEDETGQAEPGGAVEE